MLRAQSRLFPEWIGDAVIKPEVFGGGSGVANGVADTAAFNMCVLDGRPIEFTFGRVYYIGGSTVSSSSTCPGMFCRGGLAEIKPPSGSTSSTLMVTINNKDDFKVSGLFFNLPVSLVSGVEPTCDRALYFIDCDRVSVEGCRFVGGKYGPYAGGACGYVRFDYNTITQVWAAALSIEAPNVAHLTGNQISDCGFNSVASGAIRMGTSGQTAVAEDVLITLNVIRRCCEGFNQEGIDLAAAAFRNLIISLNIVDDCGNGGIELKTFNAALSPDVYESISVTGNVIRMKAAGGVGVAHNITGTIPAGKAGKVLVSGNIISCATAPTTGAPVYGITMLAYVDTTISGNKIMNVCQGVNLGGAGVSGTTNTRTKIIGNDIDAVDNALSNSSGTLDGLRVLHNDMKSVGRAIAFNSGLLTDADISYNRIESTTSYGMELRGASDSVVSYNKIKAAINGVLTQGTACANVEFLFNRITTSGGSASDAFGLGTGTGLALLNNRINVPASLRTVQGAATYTSAGNIRGMASADPSATTAGALGDIFLNSAPSSGGVEKWICTTAGDATAAIYKGTPIA